MSGRPTKYKPEYCGQVIEHMAEGKSLTAFAAEIDVHRDTISEWCRVHEPFSVAVKKGKAKCAAWWEARCRNLAVGGDGNPTSVIFGLKNMAPDEWREKIHNEHTGKDGGPITTQDVTQLASDFRSRIAGLASRTGEAEGDSEPE